MYYTFETIYDVTYQRLYKQMERQRRQEFIFIGYFNGFWLVMPKSTLQKCANGSLNY